MGWFSDLRQKLLGTRAEQPNMSKRAFEAGSWARQGVPIGGDVTNFTVQANLWSIRVKSQNAVANNPHMANAVNNWVSAVVGSGIEPTSKIADPAPAASVHKSFAQWAMAADADGRTDFYGLQAQIMRDVVVNGEAFLSLIATDSGLRLRILRPEACDITWTRELPNGGRVVQGVEFDASGQRVAYWLHPNVNIMPFFHIAPPIRVPAEDICHIFKPIFAGQVRGVPWAAPILVALQELDQLLDALLVGAKVAAMMTGFLTDQNATAGTSPFTEGQQHGSVLDGGLEPGTIKVLPSGFDIKFSTPQASNSAMDLAKLTLRSIAAGLGVPEYLLTGDLSQANYSSLRAGLTEFRRRAEQVTHHVLIPTFLRPVWRRWMTLEILAGRIVAPGFEADPESWLSVLFYPPPIPILDPLKDTEADAEAIAAGLKSRRQALAERGLNIEVVDAEIAADKAREKGLGINFDTAVAAAVKVPTVAR